MASVKFELSNLCGLSTWNRSTLAGVVLNDHCACPTTAGTERTLIIIVAKVVKCAATSLSTSLRVTDFTMQVLRFLALIDGRK